MRKLAAQHFLIWVVALLAIGGVVIVANPSGRTSVVDAYENWRLTINPSAQLAYDYGVRHFDAGHAAAYDVDRAAFFFAAAEKLDANLPHVHHQLARIAFLKGDFQKAMLHINTELENNPQPSPSSYYVRGLIEGYMGDYDAALRDYEVYLQSDLQNWAALNDYAWVLLQAHKAHESVVVTTRGLEYFPENPWLLNTNAIGLYEIGSPEVALVQAQAAAAGVALVTQEDWLRAYPGNDPHIAPFGMDALKEAIQNNMHTIQASLQEEEATGVR